MKQEFIDYIKKEYKAISGHEVEDLENAIMFIIEFYKKEAEYWEHEFHEVNAILEDPSLRFIN